MNNVAIILSERQRTHGDFRRVAQIAQALKEVMHGEEWDRLTIPQRESLDMITTKIARIISGDSDCEDHWNDISGYAQLPLKHR